MNQSIRAAQSFSFSLVRPLLSPEAHPIITSVRTLLRFVARVPTLMLRTPVARNDAPGHDSWVVTWARYVRCPNISSLLTSARCQFAASVSAVAYQLFVTRPLTPISDTFWRPQPLMVLGIVVVAIAHLSSTLRNASKVGCGVLVMCAVQRLFAALFASDGALHEELTMLQRPGMHATILVAACFGASLGFQSHLSQANKKLTSGLFNCAFVTRMLVAYYRTGIQPVVTHDLLYVCLPFSASLLLSWTRRKEPPDGPTAHGVTPIHVSSDCAACDHFLATAVLKPCGLGLCPDCFEPYCPHPNKVHGKYGLA